METVENKLNLIQSLLESTIDYGKTTAELVKLKALHKTSDVVSSALPHLITIVVVIFFVLFISFGFAYWLGIILENTFYGFFIVGGFYGITALLIFVMHKGMKKMFGNFIVKQLFK